MYFLLVGKKMYTFVVLAYKEVFLGINSEIMYEKQIFWSRKTNGFGVRTVHPTPWGGGRNAMNATFPLLVSLYSWGGDSYTSSWFMLRKLEFHALFNNCFI